MHNMNAPTINKRLCETQINLILVKSFTLLIFLSLYSVFFVRLCEFQQQNVDIQFAYHTTITMIIENPIEIYFDFIKIFRKNERKRSEEIERVLFRRDLVIMHHTLFEL